MTNTETKQKTISVALAGNPNSGKTTLFNALIGAHRKVGNYPGVTVEKHMGVKIRNDTRYEFTDLPGTYSLTAYSIDEVVARDFLLEQKPDVVVDVIDSSNLARHLYLCLQFQELGIPVIAALNMTDEAENKGIKIDAKKLSALLGLPVVKTVGTKAIGLDILLDTIDAVVANISGSKPKTIYYGDEIESRLMTIEKAIVDDTIFCSQCSSRWIAVKLLEKDSHVLEMLKTHKNSSMVLQKADESIAWIEQHFNKDAEIAISEQRYGYINGAVKEAVKVESKANFSLTEKIDKVIMNRFLALPIFVAVLWLVFKLTFTIGAYPQGWLEKLFAWLTEVVKVNVPEGWIQSLIADGILAGVGGVFSFVPLIIILFFFLSLLEDLGYMSRAAFATDKILHSFGLHGQSMFPMMLGFGCSVPAIMGARTLKSQKDRIATILVIPFMSCGAKLPVYVLLAAAFFPGNESNMVMLIYGIGVVLALISSLVLKKTVLKGDSTPFVMELPPYRIPTVAAVLWHVWEKTWKYVKKAGTIILASAVFIWIITSFPTYTMPESELLAEKTNYIAENPESTEDEVDAYLSVMSAEKSLEHSAAGVAGKFIEPVLRPLGFNWKVSVASITGFTAKEVVVSTLGILYSVGSEENEESQGLIEALQNDPDFSPLVGLVLMIFTLIVPPCFASMAVMKTELGWKWLAFSIISLLVLGWILGFAVYQIGSLVIAAT